MTTLAEAFWGYLSQNEQTIFSYVAENNTILIDFQDFVKNYGEFASAFLLRPLIVQDIMNHALREFLKSKNVADVRRVGIHFKNILPPQLLKNLSATQINTLVEVQAVVRKIASPMAVPVVATYVCQNEQCGSSLVVDLRESDPPATCPHCKKRMRLDENSTTYIDVQEIVLQEMPENSPAGEIPFLFPAVLYEDFVGIIRPGTRVRIAGLLRAKPPKKNTTPYFAPYLHVVSLEPLNITELQKIKISDKELKLIKEIASGDPLESLAQSYAPLIYESKLIKKALCIALFSGERRVISGQSVRNEIHLLIAGDPSTGKSQLLRFAHNVAPRAVYVAGRGASAAGLTATVSRNASGSWEVDPGAAVIADRGFLIVDELDKMSADDRSALHTAMEQGIIPINKAGINMELNARVSVIAGMNPIEGLYNPARPLVENINLPPALLSRFDLIFVIRDIPDETFDRHLAEHVLQSRYGQEKDVPVPADLFKKYIMHARNICPVIPPDLYQKIVEYYVSMRKTSDNTRQIFARQLEAIIRVASAIARMRLSDTVSDDDIRIAIELYDKSREITMTSNMLDIESGMTDSFRDIASGIVNMLYKKGALLVKDIEALLRERGIIADKKRIDEVLAKMHHDGVIYYESPEKIRLV